MAQQGDGSMDAQTSQGRPDENVENVTLGDFFRYSIVFIYIYTYVRIDF